jgi:uncharacterized protein (UPF0333 family)
MGRGQVSMEYLVIFGFAFMLTIPLLAIYVFQGSNFQEDIATAQTEKAAEELSQAIKEVYYAGPPSRKTISVTLPKGIQNITFDNTSFTINLQPATKNIPIFTETYIPLNGSLQTGEGLHVIRVESTSAGVEIFE